MLTFIDQGLNYTLQKLEEDNQKEHKKYGYVTRSESDICEAWLSDDEPEKVIKQSQEEDLQNLIGLHDGLKTKKQVLENESPCVVEVMDFMTKTITTHKDWIIN